MCPSNAEWKYRAQSFCNNPDDYRCLWDANAREFVEQCEGYDIQMKGFRKIILGDITAGECTDNRYQPRMWTTKGNSDCVLQKSLCTEIGQVAYDDGNGTTDRSCRCDNTAGYVFLQKPKASCYCVPSVEDCTCFKKKCPPNHIVDPDYECRSINNLKMSYMYNCKEKSLSASTSVPTIVVITESFKEFNIHVHTLSPNIAVFVCTVIGVCCLLYLFKAYKRKEFQEETTSKWQEQLKLFVPTRASSAVAACLESNQCVIITGPPGCGKTFTAYSVAMEMVDREGYELLIIEHPNDILRYSRKDTKQLLFIDDILGKYSVIDYNTKWWKCHEKKDVKDILSKNPNLRIIATCRSYIYNLYNKNVCMLFHHLSFLSENICLTIDERRQIGRQYIGDNIDNIGDETISLYNFFPELCKRFNTETDELSEFHSPCGYITKELNILRNKSVEGFILLSLMVVVNNEITEENEDYYLNNKNTLLMTLLKELRFDTINVSIEHLNALCGTYFMNTNGIYTFESKRLFKVVTFCISEFIQETVLRFSEYKFIKDKFILKCIREHEFDLSVRVKDDLECRYFERMLTQIKCGQFTNEFLHWTHKYDAYRQKFIQYLKTNAGCPLSLIDNGGFSTILHVVSDLGYLDYVDFFEHLKPDLINFKDNMKRTPLHLAALKGHNLVVQSLIERKAVIDISDIDGNTPLDLACKEGHIATVNLLLLNKAPIKRNPNTLETPLIVVCKNGNFELAKMLIEAKADANVRDANSFTPLIWTVKEEFTEITQLLLDNNGNINVVDGIGRTPLHHACATQNVEMVKLLIEKGAEVSIQNKRKELPLHIACNNGCYAITVLLTSVKCNINHRDEYGNTPLYNACVNGYLDTVKLLLEKGAKVNIKNDSPSTALHAASKKGFMEIANVLLENNAEILIYDDLRKSPLHLACYKGSYDIVSLLISKCDHKIKNKKRFGITYYINEKDKNGNTPLHHACYNGCFEVVKLLITKGAIAGVANNDDYKPADIADKSGFPDIVGLLSTALN